MKFTRNDAVVVINMEFFRAAIRDSEYGTKIYVSNQKYWMIDETPKQVYEKFLKVGGVT